MHIAVIYHSGYGHTEVIAKLIAEGIDTTEGVNATLVQAEDAESKFDFLNTVDTMVFGCPTYMGSISAEFKKFMEASSKLWIKREWRDKLAAGFTNSHSLDGDKHNTLVGLAVFAAQHCMNWINLGMENGSGADDQVSGDPSLTNRLGSNLGLAAQSENDDASITPPQGDRDTAFLFGQRIAKATLRWGKA